MQNGVFLLQDNDLYLCMLSIQTVWHKVKTRTQNTIKVIWLKNDLKICSEIYWSGVWSHVHMTVEDYKQALVLETCIWALVMNFKLFL